MFFCLPPVTRLVEAWLEEEEEGFSSGRTGFRFLRRGEVVVRAREERTARGVAGLRLRGSMLEPLRKKGVVATYGLVLAKRREETRRELAQGANAMLRVFDRPMGYIEVARWSLSVGECLMEVENSFSLERRWTHSRAARHFSSCTLVTVDILQTSEIFV